MKNNKLNSGGFSLVELLMASAMLAVGVIGFMQFMKNRLAENKYLESAGEIERTVAAMRMNLLNKDACFETLKGINIAAIDPDNGHEITELKNKDDMPIFKFDDLSGRADAAKLVRMALYNTGAVAADSYGVIELKLEYERDQKRTIGSKNLSKSLPITVKTNAAGDVERCFNSTENAIESAYKLVCEDMGGEFNPGSGKCEFFPLVKGQHTQEQCRLAGGEVVDAGGENVCRFGPNDVPNGWTPYENWSTTTSSGMPNNSDCKQGPTDVTAGNIGDIMGNVNKYREWDAGKIINSSGCPSASHTWQNTPTEVCTITCEEISPCADGCRTSTFEFPSVVTERGYY